MKEKRRGGKERGKEKREREKKKAKMGFSLLSKIYENWVAGFHRSKR